jgi:hypothetical protein
VPYVPRPSTGTEPGATDCESLDTTITFAPSHTVPTTVARQNVTAIGQTAVDRLLEKLRAENISENQVIRLMDISKSVGPTKSDTLLSRAAFNFKEILYLTQVASLVKFAHVKSWELSRGTG